MFIARFRDTWIELSCVFNKECRLTKEWINSKKEEAEKSAIEKIQQALMDGKTARSVSLTDFQKDAVRHLCLFTMKPVIYVGNVAESDLAELGIDHHVKDAMNLASELQSGVITISATFEAEITELPPEERIEYLKSFGVD